MNHISSTALLELALDLTSSLNSADRFDRLLDTVRKAIVCDAVALLSFHEGVLKPIALQGLTKDTFGRRFLVKEHPRFAELCASTKPIRFDANSTLPDPYDGLLIDRSGDFPVHSCMGLPLYFDEKLIGLLTIDSLAPYQFEDIPERTLEMISAIASATLNAAFLIQKLEIQAAKSLETVAELSEETWRRDNHELLGESEPMQKLKREIAIVAVSDFTTLITGETGVGKELVARNLHSQSNRASGPLVVVNCAALPENLIESELFGHVKGAFSGADKQRAGKFKVANGGTLFLDEIGELPLSVQSKLLRALQSNEIQPVGQDKIEKVNVRIVAATNRDLINEVTEGRFRADLYHRLSVYPIDVPPLRHRKGDLLLLAGYFVETLRRKLNLAQLTLSNATYSLLNQYDWPGNVREFEHAISRAALKAKSRKVGKPIVSIEIDDFSDIPSSQTQAMDNRISAMRSLTIDEHSILSLKEETEAFQRQLITRILREESGNWAATARRLSMDRANLNRIAKRLNISVVKQVM